jgi:hypothetical protein
MVQSKLRYSFERDPLTGERWVNDSKLPSKREWSILGTPERAKVDYGMLTRIWDADTGGWVMMVCGIGPFGTDAAANLVIDPLASRQLPTTLRSARNFQIVLKTTVIDGSAGAPQILAVQTW